MCHLPLDYPNNPSLGYLLADNKRPRRVAEFTHEEFRATVKQMFKELLTEAEHPIGSVMVPSNDLLTIARSRGRDAAIDLKDVGIKHKPASQTVKLTLNESDYYLGFCRLKSEKLLVQPLLTQLLEKVVAPYPYTAFDVHNKRTHLFDGGMPDNLIVRNEAKPIPEGAVIDDLVDTSNALPPVVQQEEEKDQHDPNEAGPVVDLTPDYLQQHGITHDTVGLIVEGKSIDKVDDPDSHLQLLKYMRDFLLGDALRQRIIGMLTDLQVAYFYVLGRDKTEPRLPNDNDPAVPQMHHVQFLGKFTGAGILQMLQDMLSGDGDLLDDKPFVVQREGNDESLHVEFVQRLGRGGFGRVLRVKVGDEEFALKMPYRAQPVQNYNIERELEITSMIAGKCKNVPLLVEKVQAVGKGYDSLLLMTPVGVPHSRHNWTKELFIDLLDGYRNLRQRLCRNSCHAVVHRDIRPSNIILANGDGYGVRLVLIDWGCAVEEGAHGLYAGSRAYAAYRLYELKSTDPEVATAYDASCVDDYGSFLLTAAATFFMRDGMAECNHRFRSKDTDIYTMRAADWLQFWQDRLPAEWWEMYKSLSMVTDVGQAHEAVRAFLDGRLPLHTLGF